jgi:two-component system cell cycle response regulator
MPEDRSKPFQVPRIQEAAVPAPPKGAGVAIPPAPRPGQVPVPMNPTPSIGTPSPARPSVAPRGSIPPRASMPPRPSMIDLDWMAEDTSGGRATETSLPIPVPVQKANRASLTLITGLNAGQVFPLDQSDVIIGRSREAHVRIDDVGISRQHSRIVCSLDGRFAVEDMNSTNGTFVGGRRVQRSELAAGDHVQIGPNVVLKFALIDETEEALAKQLYESSTRDGLTRAFNRKYFVERLQSEVAYANRHRSKLAVVLFDLDHFKRMNDTHGHLAGDEVLRVVSANVARLIRTEDVFARYGGEEFVLLARGIDNKNLFLFSDRIRRGIEKLEMPWEGITLRATISVGIATLAECGDRATGEAMLLLADERLYRAKSLGRNRVCAE